MASSYIPVISRELDLTQYKGVQSGRSRRVTVNPDNATTYTSSTSTQDIFLSIPSSRNSFIVTNATQIVFDITVVATFATDPVISLANGSGSSCIQGIETIIQNQSVETLTNYNVYAGLVEDLQSLGRSTTVGTIMKGATSTLKTGITMSGLTGVAGSTVRCSLPLYSGVLGVGSEQWCPMVDGIRLRMTMAAVGTALKFSNITSYTAASTYYQISNFGLQLEVMDLDSATMSALVSAGGGMLKQHGCCVNNYQSTVTAASANSLLIPARFSSVKALLSTFRLSANLAAPEIYNVPGDRILPQIATYFWTVDGANVPSVPVRVASSATKVYGGEVLSEIMKIFSASNSPGFDCVFNSTSFHDLTGTTGTGSFALGVNFESQDSAGSSLLSGRDLNSSNVYLNLTHFTTASPAVCDTFALYDVILTYDMVSGSVSLSK